MKPFIFACALLVFFGERAAQATFSFSNGGSGNIYTTSGSSLSQTIPDNNPSGVAYSLSFGSTGLSVSDISVSFNMTGGYNGDMYAYLSHGSQIAVLLNQITGSAANGTGFNVTLVEGTGNPIQTASGTAGQTLLGTTFTANQNLSTFNSSDPNGNWTLFFADLSPGDTMTLNSFSISLTAVPEPANFALSLFGGLLVAFGLIKKIISRRGTNL